MTHVWVSGTYSLVGGVMGQGLWCAPGLQLAAPSKIVPATEPTDALRVGCAMAILDAFSQLGDDLVFHIPATPSPDWLVGAPCPVPLGAREERLKYITKMDSWLKAHPGRFLISDSDVLTLDALRGRDPMCADYDMYSKDCAQCPYPAGKKCEV